nr:MAG TPA: hypothetical protein [Caudoviricetes sp.]
MSYLSNNVIRSVISKRSHSKKSFKLYTMSCGSSSPPCN